MRDIDTLIAGLEAADDPGDAHWLCGWAARVRKAIEGYVDNDLAWGVYRPDALADSALMRLSVTAQGPVQSIRETVQACDVARQQSTDALIDRMMVLHRRILAAAAMIKPEERAVLTVTNAAKLTAISGGVISRACDSGAIQSTGTGRDRAIDLLSLVEWVLRKPRQDGESDDDVNRKFGH